MSYVKRLPVRDDAHGVDAHAVQAIAGRQIAERAAVRGRVLAA